MYKNMYHDYQAIAASNVKQNMSVGHSQVSMRILVSFTLMVLNYS